MTKLHFRKDQRRAWCGVVMLYPMAFTKKFSNITCSKCINGIEKSEKYAEIKGNDVQILSGEWSAVQKDSEDWREQASIFHRERTEFPESGNNC